MNTITEQLQESRKACETLQKQHRKQLQALIDEADNALKDIQKLKAKYESKPNLTPEDKSAYAALLLTEQDYLKGKRLGEGSFESSLLSSHHELTS